MILTGYGSNLKVQNETNQDYLWLNGLEEYFYTIDHPDKEKIKDIKASILYGNPYKIRNLIMSEIYRGPHELSDEFSKAIMSHYLDNEPGNDRRALQYISHCIDDEFLRTASRWSIKWHNLVNLNDHLSRGQIQSKFWMLDHLKPVLQERKKQGYDIDTVVHYGGWYATVAWFILKEFADIKQYLNLEVDHTCVGISDDFNEEFYNDSWRFKGIGMDVNDVKWNDRTFNAWAQNKQEKLVELKIGPQLIINTSCEHMSDDWFYNLPKDMLVCLQTNDYFSNEQHINCVNNVDEALEKYKFTRVYYSGELDTQLYKRFMIIGRT